MRILYKYALIRAFFQDKNYSAKQGTDVPSEFQLFRGMGNPRNSVPNHSEEEKSSEFRSVSIIEVKNAGNSVLNPLWNASNTQGGQQQP